MEVRELRDEDVPAIVRLLSETYPYDLTSEVGFRHAVVTSSPSRAGTAAAVSAATSSRPRSSTCARQAPGG